MSDAYKYDLDNIYQVINVLKTKLEDYRDIISQLTDLIDEINSSASWKDVSVKSSFISTCNAYMSIYRNVSIFMDKYINYLTKKAEGADALEKAFSR